MSLQELFDGARIGMLVTTLEGIVVQANPKLHAMWGYAPGTVIGRDLWELIPVERRATARAQIERLLAGEVDSLVSEQQYEQPDGGWLWGRATVWVVPGPDGGTQQLGMILEDIDEQRRAEAELSRSHALTRLAGTVAGVGGWALDLPSRRVTWSPEIHQILEWPGAAAPDEHEIYERFFDEDRRRLLHAVDRCVEQGVPFDLELRLRSYTGRPMWARSVAEPQYDASGRIVRINGAFQDITASKEAAHQSEALAARLTATLESITDAFYTVDREWRFTYVNAQAERQLRRDRSEMLGRNIWEAFPEARDSPMYEAYHRAMEETTTVSLDAMFYPPLDSWFEVRAYPSREGLAVYFRDVGERLEQQRQLERIAADEQAAADRLREVDRTKNAFLSAVSHELRTPLTVVQGMADTLLRLRGQLDDDQRAAIEDALSEQAHRLASLLGDLLDLDRLAQGVVSANRVEVDAMSLVTAVVTESPDRDRVDVQGPPRLTATVDRVQVQRIVANLLDNARKYAPDGRVTVRLSAIQPGGVRLEVVDEGPGIPVDERDRVFEPLYRVHDDHPRPGTGIGLALVDSFAQLHGGHATVLESDHGAHVLVEIPGAGAPR